MSFNKRDQRCTIHAWRGDGELHEEVAVRDRLIQIVEHPEPETERRCVDNDMRFESVAKRSIQSTEVTSRLDSEVRDRRRVRVHNGLRIAIRRCCDSKQHVIPAVSRVSTRLDSDRR